MVVNGQLDASSADDALLRDLRHFVERQLPKGRRLPPERELATELGVGRSALRRALAVLEAEGLLYRHVGRGTFITEPAAAGVPTLSEIYRTTNPLEVMEVRLIIEPRTARLAALRITSAEISKIEQIVAGGEASPDIKAFEVWDARFHAAIAAASRNELLSALLSIVQATRESHAWESIKVRNVTRAAREKYSLEHQQILHALRERDANEAEVLMARHLNSVVSEIKAVLDTWI